MKENECLGSVERDVASIEGPACFQPNFTYLLAMWLVALPQFLCLVLSVIPLYPCFLL